MFKKLVSKIVGDPNKKIIDDLAPLVAEVAALEPELQRLSNDDLRGKAAELRDRARDGESLESLM
ncbi:MAG: hypothetical protein R3293_12605, partial [Candidatus Promineifilaceae bacterium]|nr:hypothetical protein [Candidatus Promineifilaceae bacterium]